MVAIMTGARKVSASCFLKIWLAMCVMGAAVLDAGAAVRLSVTPLSGGANSIRFGRVDGPGEINREVRLRVTATEGEQYQVLQRVLEPFVNEQGESPGHDAISSYALVGSNGSGTLYLQSPERMSFADQLLYTSSPAGESDSFIVVYSVKPEDIRASGSFFGKIYYTVRPLGSGGSDTVILNAYLDAQGQFKVEVEGSAAPGKVSIDADEKRNEYIRVSFQGNSGGPVSIYHELEKPLENALFEPVAPDAVRVRTAGSTQGGLYAQAPEKLERRPLLLYRSEEAADEFTVHYEVDTGALAAAAAGRYEGRAVVAVETADGRKEYPVSLELEVAPMFDLDVALPADGVRFNNLLPESEPQVREVEVEVRSNLSRPYMVMQNVMAPLTNEKGGAIDSRQFSVRQELLEGEGKVQNGGFKAVETGDAAVFISDAKGSPARFKVIYRLEPYRAIEAGDYATSVKFSLSEL